MLPALTSLYPSNKSLANPVLDGEFAERSSILADIQYVSVGELSLHRLLTSISGSMCNSISLIFLRGFPRQVLWVNAAFMTVAAAVRGFMFTRWGRAMLALAHGAGGKLSFAVNRNKTIPMRVYGIWPNQARIADVALICFNPRARFTFRRTNAKCVPASQKSRVVRSAEAFSQVFLATVTNFTYGCGRRNFHTAVYTASKG